MKIKNRLAIMVLAGAAATSTVAGVTNVQIRAALDFDYGVDGVATMVSDVITARDGVATYQIAFDVRPPAGRSIRSGMSGINPGTSTNWSWGVGPEDTIFKGSDNDRVEDIGNLRVTHFNANGGGLSIADLADIYFASVTIANGQSANKDSIELVVNGSVTNNLGDLVTNPDLINLESASGVSPVTGFALAANTDTNVNKWSVNSVEVKFEVPGRADWLRGAWGLNWKPGVGANVMKSVKVDDFLDQIKDLKTIDYIQLHLNGSAVRSPNHAAPLPVLEALHDVQYDPTLTNNLVCPPASDGDNFMVWLKAIKDAGYKTQVYVQATGLLNRRVTKNPCKSEPVYDHPDDIPTISDVWKAYCHTNFQDFIDSKVTHTEQYLIDDAGNNDGNGHPERQYLFCYAEFVLKAYSERYGDLIDSWMFDGARNIEGITGDEPLLHPGDPSHLEAYKAFADAARAGNPNAAVCFNNGLGDADAVGNPYAPGLLYEDYTMGHPFNGGNDIGSTSNFSGGVSYYDQNFHLCTWISNHNGYVFADDPAKPWAKNIVGHWDPPMSTTSWKGGNTPALTQDDFNLWTLTTVKGNGALTWGLAINNDPLIDDWALNQLIACDAHLRIYQSPGAPNWARADTPLPNAEFGRAYSSTLVEGEHFWDPESNVVTVSLINAPGWMSLAETSPGTWLLSGLSTETSPTNHEFRLRIEDTSGSTDRWVQLAVTEPENPYPFKGTAQILAAADTDYGINSIATLFSAALTAPDGLATFQIAADVTPMAGGSVVSKDTSDSTTNTSWGIGSDGIFKGSAGEYVDLIGNMRITNFNANGGDTSLAGFTDLAFTSVTIANGQSTYDRVLAVANGMTNNPGGVKMAANPDELHLELITGAMPVTNFSLGVGNSSNTCKWAVNSIEVKYTVLEPNSLSEWANGYGLKGDDALAGADTIDWDGYNNLAEYALGMNPTMADAGSRESVGTRADGGTNWFEYVHNRRSDYVAQGLTYLLIDTPGLISPTPATNTQDQILVGGGSGGYESVTNRYVTDDPAKFIKLRIQQD